MTEVHLDSVISPVRSASGPEAGVAMIAVQVAGVRNLEPDMFQSVSGLWNAMLSIARLWGRGAPRSSQPFVA